MIKVVFLILNYYVTDVTEKAIKYIKENCDVEEYRIVVVDNDSPNHAYELLKQKYKNEPKIDIIKTDENIGFARGNNYGLRYSEMHYKPEFLVMMNSDLFIEEKRLYSKLKNEYEKSGFSVAGPHMITGDGNEKTNPFKTFIPTKKWFKYMIAKRKEEAFWARFGLYEKMCPFLRGRLYPKLGIFIPPKVPYLIRNDAAKQPHEQKMYNVALQGACFIFSRKYLDCYDGLNERTFLGGEELLLYIEMLMNDEVMVYMPEISTIHMVGASGKVSEKDSRKKHRRPEQFKESYELYKMALELIEQFEKVGKYQELYKGLDNSTYEWRQYIG